MTPSRPSPSDRLLLVGLDVGSTTCSVLVASARLLSNCVTGRRELGEVRPLFRPEPAFTPFADGLLDADALARQVDDWLRAAGVDPGEIAAGGALVTGLAARAANAQAIARLVRARFRDALVAVADDPCLESWLAFMGNTLGLSRAEPARPFINLDVGGGTTNLAWGLAGDVRQCGCYYVGARHVQVEPGTYRVRSLSSFGEALLAGLGIRAGPGDELAPCDVQAIVGYYVALLEAVATGAPLPPPAGLAQLHCQAAFAAPRDCDSPPVVTLSGGVGELAYRFARGEALPPATAFGDLGVDLARKICQSRVLGKYLAEYIPAGLGRATVQGLTLHNVEISGATIFLPRPDMLPLADLPVLGFCGPATSDRDLAALFGLAAKSSAGACLRVNIDQPTAAAVKAFGTRLAEQLQQVAFPAGQPLVFLTAGNMGKTLGQYATQWGRLPRSLIVVDELPARNAHFASLGRACHNIVPVTFHGLDPGQENAPP